MFKRPTMATVPTTTITIIGVLCIVSTLMAQTKHSNSSSRYDFTQLESQVNAATQNVVTATIQLPQTGQTTCSGLSGAIDCAGTGQDGDIQAGVAWPDPRFVNHGDGTVTDLLTGLMWSQAGNTPAIADCTAGKKNWQGQLDYIACLNTNNYNGHNDWRMPNVNEQKSLVNAGVVRTHIWLNNNGFTGAQYFDGYWTSTTTAANPIRAWVIPLDGAPIGRLGTAIPDMSKGSVRFVWPVRAGQLNGIPDPVYPANVWKTGQTRCWASTGFARECADTGEDGELQVGVAIPEIRFTDNTDGTVRDHLTGLTWTQDAITPRPLACVASDTMNWEEAFGYVACLNANNYLGRNTWRVPNWIEMMSLVDYGRFNAAVDSDHPFINLPVPFPDRTVTYHTSTTSIAKDSSLLNYAFVFDPNTGSQEAKVKGLEQYVWPVLEEAPVVHDNDEDGIPNEEDNCVEIPNADQADTDGDDVGDVCDACPGSDDKIDSDGDGIPNGCDPCPNDNPDDSDNDGVCDSNDPCPLDNPDDSDSDGVCNSDDGCPDDPDKTTPGDCGCGVVEGTCGGCKSDSDCDDEVACTNDTCDAKGECIYTLEDSNCDDGFYCNGTETCDALLGCQGGTAVDCTDKSDCTFDTCDEESDSCSHEFMDSDEDGVCDANDICPGFDDNVDRDGDGIPNGCDVCSTVAGIVEIDSDGDGVCDSADICPGFDDYADNDSDGTPDGCDPCPTHNPDDNADGVCGPPSSGTNYTDSDGDGVFNFFDDCKNTAPGAEVDDNGCSCDQLDDDEDGVDNCLDECANTLVSSEIVGETGCNCSQLDCDDEDTCTEDTCEDGVCSNIAIDCPDDGLFCNGVEACDNGNCTSSGNPCGENETCNEDTDTCDPDTPAPGQPTPPFNLCGNLGEGCTLTPPALILIFFGLFALRFVGPRRRYR